MSGSAPLGRTLAVIRPARARVASASLLGAGAVACDIGLLASAAWLISRAAQHPNEAALGLAIVVVQVFGLSRGLLRYAERLVGHDAAFRLLVDVRVDVYDHLEALAPVGLPAFRRGDLLARLVGDVDSLQDLVVRVVPAFAIALVVGAGAVAFEAVLLPAAGAVLAVALLVGAVGVPWLTGALARRREARFAATRGELTAAVTDLTEGAAELVVFGAAEAQVREVARLDTELTNLARASAGTAGIGLALTTLLGGLACWGALVVGIPAVNAGRLAAVDLAVITLVPLAAFELVVGLPVATQTLGRVRQSAARVFEVLDASPPVVDPPSPVALREGAHVISVRGVGARYPGAARRAIDGIDLSLLPASRVGVVGPSGSGKSTLAAVLVRFLDPEAGDLTLDGEAMNAYRADDVRRVVGLVAQDAHLFDATVAENLRIGRRDASDGQLEEVLGRVGLGPWLASLQAGLSTEVGPRGHRVSGGQRQRLCVARALLTDFPVLVLDEPVEHLEPEAADALMAELLARRDAGRAVVVITHRLSGLVTADEVLVLEGGKVAERGAPAELLPYGGGYAELWWSERAHEPES